MAAYGGSNFYTAFDGWRYCSRWGNTDINGVLWGGGGVPALFHAGNEETMFRNAIGSAPTNAKILLGVNKLCHTQNNGSPDQYFSIGHAQSWNAHNLDRMIVNKYPVTSAQASAIQWAANEPSSNVGTRCTYAVPTGVGSGYQVYEDGCINTQYTHVACMTLDQYTNEYFLYQRDPSNLYWKSTPDNQITNEFPDQAGQYVENVFWGTDIPGTYYPQTNDNPFLVSFFWWSDVYADFLDICIEPDASGNCVKWSQRTYIDIGCVN